MRAGCVCRLTSLLAVRMPDTCLCSVSSSPWSCCSCWLWERTRLWYSLHAWGLGCGWLPVPLDASRKDPHGSNLEPPMPHPQVSSLTLESASPQAPIGGQKGQNTPKLSSHPPPSPSSVWEQPDSKSRLFKDCAPSFPRPSRISQRLSSISGHNLRNLFIFSLSLGL